MLLLVCFIPDVVISLHSSVISSKLSIQDVLDVVDEVEQSESEESSEYEEYTDSEDETGPRLKPVFVRK